MLKNLNKSLVSSNKYLVRFAQDKEEIKEAQKLRFKVFNLELDEGLESTMEKGLDVDKFDKQCQHLLVIHKDLDQVIGTYRMQTYEMAQNGLGFYTAEEFHLEQMSDEILKKGVEVGRACIHKDHRNGKVLFLLWRGLAEYLKQNKSRFLFGCCSITSQSSREAWEVFDYLRNKNHYHPSIKLSTTESIDCPEVVRADEAWKDISLPQLFRLYLDLGAKVCSMPALDTEFKTIDYLILLDIEKLDERNRLLFFK